MGAHLVGVNSRWNHQKRKKRFYSGSLKSDPVCQVVNVLVLKVPSNSDNLQLSLIIARMWNFKTADSLCWAVFFVLHWFVSEKGCSFKGSFIKSQIYKSWVDLNNGILTIPSIIRTNSLETLNLFSFLLHWSDCFQEC